MDVIQTRDELQRWIGERRDRKRVLVPTMGALHRGHTSLFDRAAEIAGANGDVLATIFVNPTQFGPNEDFDAYPRQLKDDLAQCEAHGVTAIFAPEPDEMYEANASISINESRLSTHLCGASRPGHFDGVCLVVAKLFILTQANVAVFGEKDFQQLAIIRRLVRDLNFPIEIVGGETVREPDGLAMSSRNAYLSPEDRRAAPVIQQALREASLGITDGKIATPQEALAAMRNTIEETRGATIDYLAVVDAASLEPLDKFGMAQARLLAAVFFGKTRLIDNIGVPGSVS
ncbi:MAG: pantoate--beta-alanine ligase [Verrucomicrobiales bacterium]|nr:pantoate--beta-alanine ligase [Verrucomicrobiales bacterium]